jgi:MioC protein
MTGNAQLVAQELELILDDGETRVKTKLMDGLDASAFDGGGLFLVCTSTYGQGDVPDNAKALYESLLATRPDLSGVRYGLVALGDRICHVLQRQAALRCHPRSWGGASARSCSTTRRAARSLEEAATEWVGP